MVGQCHILIRLLDSLRARNSLIRLIIAKDIGNSHWIRHRKNAKSSSPQTVFISIHGLCMDNKRPQLFVKALYRPPANLFPIILVCDWTTIFFSSTAADWLETLSKFFSLCRKFNLKFSSNKCQLFLRKDECCGRIIDGDGFQFYPFGLESLLEILELTKGHELQHFICVANCMITYIPQFKKLTGPLSHILESFYSQVQKRTKRAVKYVDLMGAGGTKAHRLFQRHYIDISNISSSLTPRR